MKKFLVLYFFIFFSFYLNNIFSQTIRIGFLANKGTEKCLLEWKPTVDFLQNKLPKYNFKFIPVLYNDQESYVKEKKLDFIFTNPYLFINFRAKYDAIQLATIKYNRGQYSNAYYGSVIFAKKNKNINNITDIKNKKVVSASPQSFGGWLMVLYELKKYNIDPYKDFSAIIFSNNQDSIISAIKNNIADVGFVRTGVLENFAEKGLINLNEYTIINQNLEYQLKHNFKQLLSTELYPEWAFCKLKDTPDIIAKEVINTLLQIKESDDAAIKGNYTEFLPALDYISVSKMLNAINLFPFPSYNNKFNELQEYNSFSFKNFFIYVSLFLIIVIVILTIYYKKYLKKIIIPLETQINGLSDLLKVEREKFENFDELFNVFPVGIIIVNKDYKINLVNKMLLSMLKMNTDGDYVGLDYNVFLNNWLEKTDFSDELKEKIIRITHLSQDKATTLLLNNRYYFISHYNLPDGGFVRTFRDITDEKFKENLLNVDDLQFKQVWENSFDGMRLTNNEGIVVLVNKAFCKLVKKSPEELIGKPFSVIYKEENAENILQKGKERFIQNTVETSFERELTLWNNEKVWFELSNSFINIDKNEKLLLSIFHDITKHKHAEEEIKTYSAKLEEANKSKDKFFSIIAHELKSPFQGSLGIAELLGSDFDNLSKEDAKELIKSLHRSLKNNFNLLQNLLDWSRLQTGRIPFNPVNLSVLDIVNDILFMLNNNLKAKNIKLTVDINKNHYIFADYLMIRTVITNLVVNAIKFTYNNGEIKIYSLELYNNIKITVEDNGVGISVENLEKLFKLDCQISTLGTNNEAGTGLGLILCKEMIEKNNGTIDVESKIGIGSKFILTVPKSN